MRDYADSIIWAGGSQSLPTTLKLEKKAALDEVQFENCSLIFTDHEHFYERSDVRSTKQLLQIGKGYYPL